MRNLDEILESIIDSFNNGLSVNFIDLHPLVQKFEKSEVIKDLIISYDNNTKLTYNQVKNVEILIKSNK